MTKPKHAAAIIIQNRKVLLLQRVIDDEKAYKWTPVNETIEDNKIPEYAAIRGVAEEIGLTFTISQRLKDNIYQGRTAVFLGNVKGEIKPNAKEVAGCGWFSYQEAISLRFAFGYNKVVQELFNQGLLK